MMRSALEGSSVTSMGSSLGRGFAVCLLCGLAALSVSCAAKQGKGGLLDYSRSAKELYESAMKQFDDEDCVDLA